MEAYPQLEQDVALGLSLELETVPPVESYVYTFKARSSQNSFGPKDLLMPLTDSLDLIWVSVVGAGVVSVSWLVLTHLNQKNATGSHILSRTRSQGKNHVKPKLPMQIPD